MSSSYPHQVSTDSALSKIKTIMFDMDGTLLDLAFDNFFWQTAVMLHWADLNNHTYEEAEKILTPQINALQGTLNWYSVPYWSNVLGFDVGALKHHHRDKIKLFPSATSTLQTLKKLGLNLWLVTNAHRISLDVKLAHTGIEGYFDHIVTSSDLGHPKEDVAFWQTLQQKIPFNPKTTLFVDDNEHVLDTALSFGIGQVFSISHPDSSAAIRTNLRHPAIHDLSMLLHNL